MEKISIDPTSVMLSNELIEANLVRINSLESENQYHYRNLDEIIVNALITLDWKPKHNEKAIIIYLIPKTATYVWFTERWADFYSFKDSPAEYPYLKNGYRQDVVPEVTEDNTYHWWIIPLSLFNEINKILPFHIYPEKHLDYKGFSSLITKA